MTLGLLLVTESYESFLINISRGVAAVAKILLSSADLMNNATEASLGQDISPKD